MIESGPGIFKLNINLGIFLRKTGGLVSTQVQKLSERLSPAFSKRKPGQLVGKWFTSPSTPFLCLLRVSPSRLWEELREKTLPGFSLSEEGGQVSEVCCWRELGLISSFGYLSIYWWHSVSLSWWGLCWGPQRNSGGLRTTAKISLFHWAKNQNQDKWNQKHLIYL